MSLSRPAVTFLIFVTSGSFKISEFKTDAARSGSTGFFNISSKYGTPFADTIANCPVTNVSLEDAKKYCLWKNARLPTSAEWEYAASAGHEGIYPWGDNFNSDCCNSIEQKSNTISPVSNFPKGNTPSGIRQMAGNVWEMTTGTSMTLELRGGSYRSLCEFWGGFF